MAKKIQKAINLFCWVPLVLSFVGYYICDGGINGTSLSVWEAIYASITLYFVNPVSDNQNILILLGKFLSLIVTTNVIFSVLSFFMDSLSKWWNRMWKDSTTIYTDCELGKIICDGCKHGYLIEADGVKHIKLEKTRNHILIFSDDKMALHLLNNIQSAPGTCNIYVLLNNIDTSLLSSEYENVHYYNINDILAREYWKKNNLYNEINSVYCEKKFKIGIVGYESLGNALFKQAYLSNLYNLNQSIEYHIFGGDKYQKTFLESLILGNNDKIIVHLEDWTECINEMIDLDRIIITYENNIDVIETLINENPTLNIWAYSIFNDNLSKIFESDTVHFFGKISSFLNEQTIKSEQTYKNAKLMNLDYYLNSNGLEFPNDYELEMNRQWKKLTGFKRNSNIARADYFWIEDRKKQEGANEEEICRMEHIRWCRFHYINHWSYGTEKNEKTKSHPLLVEYDKLPYSERKKDGINILEIKNMIETLM